MEELIKYLSIGVSAIITVFTSIIAIFQKCSKGTYKKMDTLYERMLSLMEDAEAIYQPIKEKGINVSAMKKEKVVIGLQLYANANNIPFDLKKWEAEIERMIDFSNSINSTHPKLTTTKEDEEVI